MGSLVGYRFKPKDEEIITLLNKKNIDPDFCVKTINEVDIYNFEPSDLPRLSAIQSDELVWYFFCAPYYKYANSKRANRKTNMGYWKLTGKGCKIYAKHSKELIGYKRFLTFCEHGNASKKHKAEWVMHEFRSQYNSPHTMDFVICRIERKTQNEPKISTGDDGQSNQHLASNFRNHVAENNSLRVETQQLFSHLHKTNDFRNHVAENGFLMVEPQQLPSHHLQFDSRNHVAEKTIQGVEREEFVDMTSNYRNHIVKNIFSTGESQLLPNQLLDSDSINHVAEKIFSGVEYQLPSQHLTSDCRNHGAEKTFSMVDCQRLPSCHFNWTSDYRNHVAENIFPTDESQLLPSHHSVSHSGNHVPENNYPPVESQLPSHYSMSDFRDQVAEHSFSGGESMLFAQYFDGLNYNSLPALQLPINVEDEGFSGCSGLDHYSCSAQQSPINPEWGLSSYFEGFSDCNMLNFQFDDNLQGESMLFAQYFDGLNYNSLPALQSPINVEDEGFSGCSGLDHYSCSAQQSPINPEWGLSSYSEGFSDCNMLNFQFDDKQENMSSQLTVQDKYPLEETGHSISQVFNLSKSVTEVHLGDSSGTDWETLNARVNGYSPIAAGDYYS